MVGNVGNTWFGTNGCYGSILCVFNGTASAEIYTYWHTLSLHDALPISPSRCRRSAPRTTPPSSSTTIWSWRSGSAPTASIWGRATAIRRRSEEHTSELQSLMRISYALFILKKNKDKTVHIYLINYMQIPTSILPYET